MSRRSAPRARGSRERSWGKALTKRHFSAASTTGPGPVRHLWAQVNGPCQPTSANPAEQPGWRRLAARAPQRPAGSALTLPQRCERRWLLCPFLSPSHSINKIPPAPNVTVSSRWASPLFRLLRSCPFLPSGRPQCRLPGPDGRPLSRASAPLVWGQGGGGAGRGRARPAAPGQCRRPSLRAGRLPPPAPALPLGSPAAPPGVPGGASGRLSAGTALRESSTADSGCSTQSPLRECRLDLTSCLVKDNDQFFTLPGDREPEKCEHTPLFE